MKREGRGDHTNCNLAQIKGSCTARYWLGYLIEESFEDLGSLDGEGTRSTDRLLKNDCKRHNHVSADITLSANSLRALDTQ